jgi:D-3-phosphoglycerate dehydrogenase
MTLKNIVVADGLFRRETLDAENSRGRVALVYGSLADPDSIRSSTERADAVMVTVNPLPGESIAALGKSVKIIGRAGIGLDAIDLEAARRRGVAVFHTPDYCTTEVAEHAVALILALRRRLAPLDLVARSDWTNWRSAGTIRPLDETVIGVVGSGRIGREVIRMLAPFGARILVFDPFADNIPAPAERVTDLAELLKQSHVVTLHSPLTEETRHLIGEKEVSLMPRGGYLVNVSRGPLIDEDAVADALASGHLGGVALDVLTTEPPGSESRIVNAPNTMLTPHTAWYSTASERRVFDQTVEGVIAYLDGRVPTIGRMAVVPDVD